MKIHKAKLVAGRWTSRVDALEALAEIEGLLHESNKGNQIVKLIAGLPLDSLKDSMVIDRAATLLPELESEAIYDVIKKNEEALRALEAMQSAVADRRAKAAVERRSSQAVL